MQSPPLSYANTPLGGLLAWKVEKWLSEVFPGPSRIYDEYKNLPARELVIVGSACLDLAIAELISKRLLNNSREYEEFLGLNEDGRAPAGSFGARIQLALLLGIINEGDAEILRIIKKIRNRFAHRVKTGFADPVVRSLLTDLLDISAKRKLMHWTESLAPQGKERLKSTKSIVNAHPEGAAAIFLATFSTYQAYFHRLSELIERLELIRPKKNK